MDVRAVEGIEVRVRFSERARRRRVVHRYGEPPELVVPVGTSERTIRRELRLHREWILSRVASQPVRQLPPPTLTVDEARYEALERISLIAPAEAEALGVAFDRIAIRDQRTRWGSCSTSGTLSFNWRLALAPREVLDYVVVHEVCHLREPNHSQRFWSLVQTRRPRWREHRDWLSNHGWELQALQP